MFHSFYVYFFLLKPTLNYILIENTININSFFISSKDIYYNQQMFNEKMLKGGLNIEYVQNIHYFIPGNI